MTDRTTVLAVITFLGIIALVGLGGLIWLIDKGTSPESVGIVATITGAAAGSLGTMLASTRSSPPVPPSKTTKSG